MTRHLSNIEKGGQIFGGCLADWSTVVNSDRDGGEC
jgi:hypothetical protein